MACPRPLSTPCKKIRQIYLTPDRRAATIWLQMDSFLIFFLTILNSWKIWPLCKFIIFLLLNDGWVKIFTVASGKFGRFHPLYFRNFNLSSLTSARGKLYYEITQTNCLDNERGFKYIKRLYLIDYSWPQSKLRKMRQIKESVATPLPCCPVGCLCVFVY